MFISYCTNNYDFVGLAIAVAAEESGLLNRLAIFTLYVCGNSDRLLLIWFMVPSAFYSMWTNDTELTVMLVKTVQLVLNKIDPGDVNHPNNEINSSYGKFMSMHNRLKIESIQDIEHHKIAPSIRSSISSLNEDNLICYEDLDSNCQCIKCKDKHLKKR